MPEQYGPQARGNTRRFEYNAGDPGDWVTLANGVRIPTDVARAIDTITKIAGNVVGPSSSVDGRIARWDGTTGRLLKDPGGAVAISEGGSGQTAQQAAIDALTDVSGATDEHVLTKDTGTGNAIFKAASGGPLSKFDATVDPTRNEDSDDGYAVGSLWGNVTADRMYICIDATVAGAVWILTTQYAIVGPSEWQSPDDTDDFMCGQVPVGCTVVKCMGEISSGTSCTVSFKQRAFGSGFSGGTLIKSVVCDTVGKQETTDFALTALDYIEFDVTGVVGAPAKVRCSALVRMGPKSTA